MRLSLSSIKQICFLLLLVGCADSENGGAIVRDNSIEPEKLKNPSDDEASVLFDRENVIEIRLTLPAREWEQLNANAVEEKYTPADVTIRGEFLKKIGLRFKGSYGSLYFCFDEAGNRLCDKLSLKLKFNEYVKEQRFLGLKRINLHSMKDDYTKMRACLAYDIFRDMGIVAPRCAYADVYVNDEHLGLYGLVEQVDGRFTKSRFSMGDGNLYKEAWPGNTQWYYFSDHLKTNEETADHNTFITFSEEMMRADDDTLPEVLGRWTDIDYILRYMAVDFAIANWDGITTFYCGYNWPCLNHNYYIYQEEKHPFFWLIPWDLDATFSLDHWLGDIQPWDNLDAKCTDIPLVPEQDYFIRPAGCDPTIRAIALADRERYEGYLREILETHLTKKAMLKKIVDLGTLIEPYIDQDPDISSETWFEALEWLLEELDLLRERMGTP
jgi:spore coat protein H